MRSLKNILYKTNLYGRSFNHVLGYTTFNIKKIPNKYKDQFSDDTHCWIDWIGDDGVEYAWDVCINNIKKGVWVLR